MLEAEVDDAVELSRLVPILQVVPYAAQHQQACQETTEGSSAIPDLA